MAAYTTTVPVARPVRPMRRPALAGTGRRPQRLAPACSSAEARGPWYQPSAASPDDLLALLRERRLAAAAAAAGEGASPAAQQQQQQQLGTVHLVGTGPGDPGLLTLRAVQLMQTADVVLYDRLVSEDILQMVHPGALLVYVGKQRSFHTRTQDEIHELLLQFTGQGATVLRLKGGDPYVFGRGGEEVQYLEARGVRVKVVPGITAASGISAELGIPLTHRGLATSVRFLTGHSREGGESELDGTVAASGADPHTTLVVYMGLSTLPTLTAQLAAAGLSLDTPAVAVERGTTPEQRAVYAPLGALQAAVGEAALVSPTLIVIGQVVSLAPGWQRFQATGQSLDAPGTSYAGGSSSAMVSSRLPLLALVLLLAVGSACGQATAADSSVRMPGGRRSMGRQLNQRAGGAQQQQQQQPQPQPVPAATAANATQQQQPAAAVNATQPAQQQPVQQQQQQLVGCLNPANPQCDGQCETCQPNGQCAPRQGACGAGLNRWWAGTCQAGRCVATGCNNPANKQCDGQCQACAASGQCVAKPGPCKAGPQQLWAGICSAGTCQAIGCNNPAAIGEDRCDSQCETCLATGACQPKSGDCALSSTRGLVKGKCMAGMCQPLPSPPPAKPVQQPPPPQQQQQPAAAQPAQQKQKPAANATQPAQQQQQKPAQQPAKPAGNTTQPAQQQPAKLAVNATQPAKAAANATQPSKPAVNATQPAQQQQAKPAANTKQPAPQQTKPVAAMAAAKAGAAAAATTAQPAAATAAAVEAMPAAAPSPPVKPVAVAAAAADEAAVPQFVPYDVGVTNAAAPSSRFVVLTWAVSASWSQQLLGFKVQLEQEEAAAGSFTAVPGWDGTVVQTRLDASRPQLPAGLKQRTIVTETASNTHYRLTIRVDSPSAGPRVRVQIQSALADGSFSTPMVITSAS
ncbi:uroporphyrinogen-III C-methyltransferase [Chlorella sorokiniana]|uniref:uroporphyrinogen-III C-methyltransferase n=1 Tax=Chlorella sorokiniana TaxID=3076 RepID=A0A2P6TG46_CHLSO|nr:uroporphyrinogen-III C-methyltransferase [Chlorella sorokiniana]|eukprot:PRW33094.1 uroporphyrinogen-III C-methyltransferase [Chlorella sorokiniana]